eukprot:8796515-Pyramimonas_sp.AAC.1
MWGFFGGRAKQHRCDADLYNDESKKNSQIYLWIDLGPLLPHLLPHPRLQTPGQYYVDVSRKWLRMRWGGDVFSRASGRRTRTRMQPELPTSGLRWKKAWRAIATSRRTATEVPARTQFRQAKRKWEQ